MLPFIEANGEITGVENVQADLNVQKFLDCLRRVTIFMFEIIFADKRVCFIAEQCNERKEVDCETETRF